MPPRRLHRLRRRHRLHRRPGGTTTGLSMRWWDGMAWGPLAPGGGRNSDDRTLSILTHGGVLIGGFVLPLVFYLIADDETRPETRWHSREALNFQLSFLVAYLGAFIVFFVGLAASGAFGASGSEPGPASDSASRSSCSSSW